MKATLVILLAFMSGCAVLGLTPQAARKDQTLKCVKELKDEDTSIKAAYEVCKDLYRSHFTATEEVSSGAAPTDRAQ